MIATPQPAELIEERSREVHSISGVSSMSHLDAPSIAVVAEPPWPATPQSLPIEWEEFDRHPNYLAAHIVAGLLENEGVPTIVESSSAFPGTLFSAIWVPKHLLHRARWILAWPAPSDAELLFLATGEFPSNQSKP